MIDVSQRSKRFVAFIISEVILSVPGIMSIFFARNADPATMAGLVVAATTAPATLALGYVAATNWHDRGARIASIQAAPGATKQPATQVKITDSAVEIPNAAVSPK